MAGDSYRLFLCARCRAVVTLCSDCDRFHRYCSKACSDEARREDLRDAGKRYRATEKGKANGRERSRRKRERDRISVTHQSSPISPPEGEASESREAVIVAAVAAAIPDVKEEEVDAISSVRTVEEPVLRCTICKRPLPPFARRGFLPFPRRSHRRGARPRLFAYAPSG